MATYIFSPAEHIHLLPYLASLHAACITRDHITGTLLPPLNHERLLTWWKDRISEVKAGTRVILLLLAHLQPGTRAEGRDLMGLAMLNMPGCDDTGPFRATIENVLVDQKCRRQGVATNLVGVLEAEAFKRGKTLLVSVTPSSDDSALIDWLYLQMLDVPSNTAAESFFRARGYIEVGSVPNYAFNPVGHLRSQTFFFKSLAA